MRRSVLISTIVLAALTSTLAVAQERSDNSDITVVRTHDDTTRVNLYWLTVGGGPVQPGIGGLLKFTYAWGYQSLSAKAEGGSEFKIFNGPENSVTEISIYYGRQTTERWTMVRVAAGPAYFIRSIGGNSFRRVGVGLEIEAMAKFYVVGASILGSAMLAPNIAFVGLTLDFSVGKLDDL